MSVIDDESFTTKMRKATKEVHAFSDALVNAKLIFALSDNQVWADGLLVFYEVFRYIEEAAERMPRSLINKLLTDRLKRAQAFKDDLDFYMYTDWIRDYQPRASVKNYIRRLRFLEMYDPNMLLAYVYHLYMGLLSGGQILQKKRKLFAHFPLSKQSNGSRGTAVSDFGDQTIASLKHELRTSMNDIANDLDNETKEKLIDESKVVFQMNNEIIKTVQGTNQVLLKKLVFVIIIFQFIAFFIYYMFAY